jgi:hypothetical protein
MITIIKARTVYKFVIKASTRIIMMLMIFNYSGIYFSRRSCDELPGLLAWKIVSIIMIGSHVCLIIFIIIMMLAIVTILMMMILMMIMMVMLQISTLLYHPSFMFITTIAFSIIITIIIDHSLSLFISYFAD